MPRFDADGQLAPHHARESQLLVTLLTPLSQRFVLVILRYGDAFYRDAVMAHLAQEVEAGRLEVEEGWPDQRALLAALARFPAHQPVHLLGLGRWLRGTPDGLRCRMLNYARERIALDAARPLLVWLEEADIRLFANEIPDLWAWRSAVLDFLRPVAEPLPPRPFIVHSTAFASLDRNAALVRIGAITDYLAGQTETSLARTSLREERGALYQQLGEWDLALADLATARDLFQQGGDPHRAALAQCRVVEILLGRGELASAQRLVQEELLSQALARRDERVRAEALHLSATILELQDQWDEALRTLQEEKLPLVEQLGDVRERAVTMGEIALILQSRGEMAEALRILREEVLPVFERVGDVRSHAAGMSHVAAILQARGETDEALRIQRELLLPVWERLGDLNGLANTHFALAELRMSQWRGDAEGLLGIVQGLSTAFDLVQKLQTPVGIATVGGTLGRLFAEMDKPQAALAVLADAAASARKLGWDDRVQALEQRIAQLPGV